MAGRIRLCFFDLHVFSIHFSCAFHLLFTRRTFCGRDRFSWGLKFGHYLEPCANAHTLTLTCSLLAQVLQELTRSRQWASVAKHPSIIADLRRKEDEQTLTAQETKLQAAIDIFVACKGVHECMRGMLQMPREEMIQSMKMFDGFASLDEAEANLVSADEEGLDGSTENSSEEGS